ncbi:hypothetical protein Ddye_001574 [Dipteronia dyeriana]|uniref:Polygalacturonase n=1 Tax=Dipteronia dyeriana TaxID=168575 RepID=A0AAD9XP53_9ROSI|nr:hypothetical protein Ddye_001574 [Dipteronia dyeriana]
MGNLKVSAMFLLLVSIAKVHPGGVFDVRKYVAKADGKSDISKALCSAFIDACACPTPSKVLIPKGTFMFAQVSLEGPCKATVTIVVRGKLKALTDPSKMKVDGSWVTF